MKHCIKTVTWKFKDSAIAYPQLKDRKIKVTSPQDVFDNFRFLFDGEVKERFVVFGLTLQTLSPALR